ncbi:MAG: hypothetical protein LBL41_01990 [Bifidobacteriaceae bacterium]|jgi:molybdopterin/thiamine biosynthesis adenylyltransferase|nr:hypothetical protein [Bifidobacteriaceae bacterium]
MGMKTKTINKNLRAQTKAEMARISLLPGVNVTEIAPGKVHIGYDFDAHALCIENLKKSEVNYVKTLVPCDQRRSLQEKYGASLDNARKHKLHAILQQTNLLETQKEYVIADKSVSGTSILPQLNMYFDEEKIIHMFHTLDKAIVGINKLDRLGALVAYQLAANRIGKIVVGIGKSDLVQAEDVGEIFTSQDVGLPKLEIFKRHLQERNFDTEITRYCGIGLSFCILNCTFTNMGITAIPLMSQNVPHMFTLINQVSIEVSNVTVPGKSACVNCYKNECEKVNSAYKDTVKSFVKETKSMAKMPSDVALINNAAGIVTKKVVQHITGIASSDIYTNMEIVKPLNLGIDCVATNTSNECGCCARAKSVNG